MDYKELRDLAEAGGSDYQLLLARLYGKGSIDEISTSIEPDLEKCFYWCLKAAKQGQVRAQANLGNMYCQAIGTEQDIEEGFYWYHEASLAGHIDSMVKAGLMLLIGQGTSKGVHEGLELLYQAANDDNAEAQMLIGSIYFEGRLVEKDLDEAKYWLKAAAKNGDPNAQYNLGMLFMQHPNPLKRSHKKAYKWLFTSIENDAEYSEHAERALDMLSEHLTEKEIKAAQNKAFQYF